MRFRSLRMKLSLDFFKRTVAILGYGDFEIDNDRPLGVVSAFQFQSSN